MKKILIACDSFKGSLSAREVAEACRLGLHEVAPDCKVVCLPLADGGEGSLDAVVEGAKGSYVEIPCHDPLGRPIRARYGLLKEGERGVVELAAASGLTLLRPEERNPLRASTYGFGELIAHALRSGCRRLLLCIGGSATVDGGLGMLRALGFRLYDGAGCEVVEAEGLEQIRRIDPSGRLSELDHSELVVACDVRNPLCGAEGAAAIYGPQKGATPDQVALLERGLCNLARVIEAHNGCSVAQMAGGGAAGGVAAALVTLLGARMARGAEVILRTLRFEEELAGAALVITGEGQIDRQTLMGKLPLAVLEGARRGGIPCVAMGGRVRAKEELLAEGFAALYAITPEGMPLSEAMRPAVARENIRLKAHEIAREWGL